MNNQTSKAEKPDPAKDLPKSQKREIRGNLPYLSSPTYIKRVLDAALEAERPESFSKNWINTVLHISGGATGSVPNFVKKLGFVSSDGSPTERFSRFKTDSGRAEAAYEGLKQAYAELYAKNEVVHFADENKVVDYIVEITGLVKNDPVVRHIYNCFDAVRGYVPREFVSGRVGETPNTNLHDHGIRAEEQQQPARDMSDKASLGLSYHINIVLPETDNQEVLDAIFKSVKRNLL